MFFTRKCRSNRMSPASCPACVLKRTCCEVFCKIPRKVSLPVSFLMSLSLSKRDWGKGVYLIYRTGFVQNICELLLLNDAYVYISNCNQATLLYRGFCIPLAKVSLQLIKITKHQLTSITCKTRPVLSRS